MLLSKPLSHRDFIALEGQCPVDLGPAGYVKFSRRDIDFTLASAIVPYAIRICPNCLSASSEPDFFSTLAKPTGDGSLTDILREPQRHMARHFIHDLPLRLDLVQRRLKALSPEEWASLMELRKGAVDRSLSAFIKTANPQIPEANLAALTNHVRQLMLAHQDLNPVIQKMTAGAGFPGKLPPEHPWMHLQRGGLSILDVVRASFYGAPAGAIDASILKQLPQFDVLPARVVWRLVLLHFSLERLSFYVHYVSHCAPLRQQIQEKLTTPDALQFETLLEDYLVSDQARKTQSHYYDFLNLGRNYFKAAWFTLLARRRGVADAGALRDAAEALLRKAIDCLETSLVTEKYPQWGLQDKVTSLNQHDGVRVPFYCGEFGVRHLLCCAYNELGRIRAECNDAPEALAAIGQEIRSHWMKTQASFRHYDFGAFQDPDAVQLVIPRMVAFASLCFHPETADSLKKMVSSGQDKLYSRYMSDASAQLEMLKEDGRR